MTALLVEDTQADPASYLCRDEFMTAANLLWSCCRDHPPASPRAVRPGTRGLSQRETRGDSLVVALTGAWHFNLDVYTFIGTFKLKEH